MLYVDTNTHADALHCGSCDNRSWQLSLAAPRSGCLSARWHTACDGDPKRSLESDSLGESCSLWLVGVVPPPSRPSLLTVCAPFYNESRVAPNPFKPLEVSLWYVMSSIIQRNTVFFSTLCSCALFDWSPAFTGCAKEPSFHLRPSIVRTGNPNISLFHSTAWGSSAFPGQCGDLKLPPGRQSAPQPPTSWMCWISSSPGGVLNFSPLTRLLITYLRNSCLKIRSVLAASIRNLPFGHDPQLVPRAEGRNADRELDFFYTPGCSHTFPSHTQTFPRQFEVSPVVGRRTTVQNILTRGLVRSFWYALISNFQKWPKEGLQDHGDTMHRVVPSVFLWTHPGVCSELCWPDLKKPWNAKRAYSERTGVFD